MCFGTGHCRRTLPRYAAGRSRKHYLGPRARINRCKASICQQHDISMIYYRQNMICFVFICWKLLYNCLKRIYLDLVFCSVLCSLDRLPTDRQCACCKLFGQYCIQKNIYIRGLGRCHFGVGVFFSRWGVYLDLALCCKGRQFMGSQGVGMPTLFHQLLSYCYLTVF